jgi:hypothetical protein
MILLQFGPRYWNFRLSRTLRDARSQSGRRRIAAKRILPKPEDSSSMSLVSVCHKRDIRKSAAVLPDFGLLGVARNAATRADPSAAAFGGSLVLSTVTTANSIASVKSSIPPMHMLLW